MICFYCIFADNILMIWCNYVSQIYEEEKEEDRSQLDSDWLIDSNHVVVICEEGWLKTWNYCGIKYEIQEEQHTHCKHCEIKKEIAKNQSLLAWLLAR